jgi:hypothetical protein
VLRERLQHLMTHSCQVRRSAARAARLAVAARAEYLVFPLLRRFPAWAGGCRRTSSRLRRRRRTPRPDDGTETPAWQWRGRGAEPVTERGTDYSLS